MLETLPRAEGALARAEAEVAERMAELARARCAVTAGKVETEAQIALARTRLDGAACALSRGDQLAAHDTLTPAKLEALQTAHAALAAIHASRLLAETDMAETTVRAPVDGRIVAIPTRLGEPAPVGGLMRLAVDGPMVAVLEVHQDQIHLMQTGAQVSVQSPAFAGELTGHVVQIGIEVQRQAVFAADPAANLDARVFAVRVELDPDAATVARGLINRQVLARIITGSAS